METPVFKSLALLGAQREVPEMLPGDVESALIAGFTNPSRCVRHGDRKILAARIRFRVAAVNCALAQGVKAPLRFVAEQVGKSERNIHQHFVVKEALYAFPPPEFASALVASAASAKNRSDVSVAITPLFEALDGNPEGRKLFANLVTLYDGNRCLRDGDNYFASELDTLLRRHESVSDRRAHSVISFFTEEVRQGFREWATNPQQSVMTVANSLAAVFDAAAAAPPLFIGSLLCGSVKERRSPDPDDLKVPSSPEPSSTPPANDATREANVTRVST